MNKDKQHKKVPALLTVLVTFTAWGVVAYDCALEVGVWEVDKDAKDGADFVAFVAMIGWVVFIVLNLISYWSDDD